MNTKAYSILLTNSFDYKKVVLTENKDVHSESHF